MNFVCDSLIARHDRLGQLVDRPAMSILTEILRSLLPVVRCFSSEDWRRYRLTVRRARSASRTARHGSIGVHTPTLLLRFRRPPRRDDGALPAHELTRRSDLMAQRQQLHDDEHQEVDLGSTVSPLHSEPRPPTLVRAGDDGAASAPRCDEGRGTDRSRASQVRRCDALTESRARGPRLPSQVS